MNKKIIISWILQVVVAGILLQTLYFKFGGHPESVAIFRELGIEPWGRIGTGLLELGVAILLLTPKTIPIGAALGTLTMLGALGSHVAKLGFSDGHGSLAFLAVVVLVSCGGILFIRCNQLKKLLGR